MSSNKNDNNFKDKKYLVVIVILIIISALILSINNVLNKKRSLENIVDLNKENINVNLNKQNYLETTKPELRTDDKIIGRADAKLKVFIYEDYDDEFSAKLAENINTLIKENNDLAFVIRPFIGSSIKSQENALALSCVNSLSDWQILRNEIMTSLSLGLGSDLELILNKMGINNDQFSACLTKAEKTGKIEELKKETMDYQIFGSPTIFVNDEIIFGARPYDNYKDENGDEVEGLKNIINRALISF